MGKSTEEKGPMQMGKSTEEKGPMQMDINLFELQDALDVLKEKGVSKPTKEEIEEEVQKKRGEKYGSTGSLRRKSSSNNRIKKDRN
ncbi:MAG: hypothetical protein B6U76_00015 [Desulfurococcales archaeon ex4484_217_2]|nr:MAG: hypothetical protein B6U76_00015 [Desulfurococcales archaeon ex4484_217_2]